VHDASAALSPVALRHQISPEQRDHGTWLNSTRHYPVQLATRASMPNASARSRVHVRLPSSKVRKALGTTTEQTHRLYGSRASTPGKTSHPVFANHQGRRGGSGQRSGSALQRPQNDERHPRSSPDQRRPDPSGFSRPLALGPAVLKDIDFYEVTAHGSSNLRRQRRPSRPATSSIRHCVSGVDDSPRTGAFMTRCAAKRY